MEKKYFWYLIGFILILQIQHLGSDRGVVVEVELIVFRIDEEFEPMLPGPGQIVGSLFRHSRRSQ